MHALFHAAHAHLRLVRPLNLVILVAGVALGAVLVGGLGALGGASGLAVWLAALSAACVGAGGNAFNDLADLGIDKVNRPDRPLAAGRVAPGAARALWLGLTAAGVALAAAVSAWHAGVALIVAAMLWLYSARFKKLPLVGNVVVAGLIALAIVYGGKVVGAGSGALVGATFAFLTTLAREIVKDVEDEKGDRLEGAHTLPVAVGTQQAVRVAQGVVALTLVLAPLPSLVLGYEPIYLLVVLAAAAFLLAALVHLHAPDALRPASRALKSAMVLGIVALALGAPL